MCARARVSLGGERRVGPVAAPCRTPCLLHAWHPSLCRRRGRASVPSSALVGPRASSPPRHAARAHLDHELVERVDDALLLRVLDHIGYQRHQLALVLPVDASDGLVLICLDTMVDRAGGDGPPARLAR